MDRDTEDILASQSISREANMEIMEKLEIVLDPHPTKKANKGSILNGHVSSGSLNDKDKDINYSYLRNYKKLGYALAYALSSFLLMSVNKVILTSWKFPSPTVLVVGQILVTLVILSTAKKLKMVKFPDFSRDTFMKLHPLPILYLGNAVTGLGGTKELSLPMFTAVRRFAILLTMAGEYYLLGVRSTFGVQFSVYVMMAGSFIAACHDAKFTVLGYSMVMLNNVFTSIKGVIVKQKLESTDFGPYGIMFYNALFTLFPAIVISFLIRDIEKAVSYPHWHHLSFCIYFMTSCVLGTVLIWSVVECTNHNSALTTAIVGTIKNIFITYIGMFIGGDYVLEVYNFLGLNLSVFGSFIYIYVMYTNYPNS